MNKTEDDGSVRFRSKGGLEARLDCSAWAVLILGLIGATLVLISTGLVAAAFIGANAWIMWLALHSLAEIVRLQKRANDLPYSGEISQTEEVAIRRCGSCGDILEGTTYCESCQKSVVGAE